METIQPTRNVVVGVDVQNDFISGSLAVTEGEQVVAPLNALASRAREQNGTVVFTRDWHPAQTPHFEAWPVHCVQETDGAAFHPELEVKTGDTILSKGTGQTDGYSGMEGRSETGSTLESLATPESPVQRVNVFIGGLATDYCVKATAIDLATRFKDEERVKTYLIRDAVRAVNLQPDDETKALQAMEACGVEALSSQQIIETFFAGEQ